MVVVIITIHIVLFVDAIVLFLWISMFQDALLLQKLFFMEFFNYKKKLTVLVHYYLGTVNNLCVIINFSIFLFLKKNKKLVKEEIEKLAIYILLTFLNNQIIYEKIRKSYSFFKEYPRDVTFCY